MNKKPILSDHDKRNVLSAKKKHKVILKNLLVQPFERYWWVLELFVPQRQKAGCRFSCVNSLLRMHLMMNAIISEIEMFVHYLLICLYMIKVVDGSDDIYANTFHERWVSSSVTIINDLLIIYNRLNEFQ